MGSTTVGMSSTAAGVREPTKELGEGLAKITESLEEDEKARSYKGGGATSLPLLFAKGCGLSHHSRSAAIQTVKYGVFLKLMAGHILEIHQVHVHI